MSKSESLLFTSSNKIDSTTIISSGVFCETGIQHGSFITAPVDSTTIISNIVEECGIDYSTILTVFNNNIIPIIILRSYKIDSTSICSSIVVCESTIQYCCVITTPLDSSGLTGICCVIGEVGISYDDIICIDFNSTIQICGVVEEVTIVKYCINS